MCSKLLRDATLTPCCNTSFCDECVRNALADNDMLCPDCESRIKNVGKLVVDEGRRERVKKYIDEVVEASREEEEEVKEDKVEEGAQGMEAVDAVAVKPEVRLRARVPSLFGMFLHCIHN